VGSNQCVATTVYGSRNTIDIENLLINKEEPHMDNSLNLTSLLSFPVKVHNIWAKLKSYSGYLSLLVSSDLVMPPGGANPTGVLGQIEGALELAKQIENGDLPEPEDIFLPIGSSCTITGLIFGIALARKLKIGFKKPLEKLRIHGVIIHHATAKLPFLYKILIKWLIKETHKILNEPKIEEIHAVYNRVHFETRYAGKYGGMTPEAENAKKYFQKDSGHLQTLVKIIKWNTAKQNLGYVLVFWLKHQPL